MMISDLISNYIEYSLTLIQLVCVITVVAYLLTRSSLFDRITHSRPTRRDLVITLFFFGIVSVYGTMTRIWLLGAEVNILDLGPMVGGLFAGPVVGIGAGLIGGLFRYSLGGIAAEPCSFASVLAGLLGGLVWYLNQKKFLTIYKAILFAVCIEILHDILALVMITPYDTAVNIVSNLTVPITLANAAGMAIFAIIIHNRISEEKTRVERDTLRAEIYQRDVDLRAARQIQERFLPNSVPQVDGISIAPASIPAQDVGGDFYDFIYPIRESLLGLVIADVSGKGVPAALFMGLSKTLTWANLVREESITSAIAGANRMIMANATPGMFVTLWCGLIDPASRELAYVNAGHPPPLVIREDGTTIRLNRTGMALGVFDNPYREELVLLREGDLLILYTDGIFEAVDAGDQQYGLDRMIRVIQEHRQEETAIIVQEVLDDLSLYTSGTAPFDDITLVVIRI